MCNTRDKEAFGSGGWRPYFGKRLWDTRAVSMLVGTLFPATASVAANELLAELKAQYASAMAMLEQAAKDAVGCPSLRYVPAYLFFTKRAGSWQPLRPDAVQPVAEIVIMHMQHQSCFALVHTDSFLCNTQPLARTVVCKPAQLCIAMLVAASSQYCIDPHSGFCPSNWCSQGDDLKSALERMFNDLIAGAESGTLKAPVIDKKTFGIKGAIIRVSCSNQAAGFKLPSEGYYQLAFAYRINA